MDVKYSYTDICLVFHTVQCCLTSLFCTPDRQSKSGQGSLRNQNKDCIFHL